MPNLKVKPDGSHGRVTHVTPESAGWTYVGFDLHRLKPVIAKSASSGSAARDAPRRARRISVCSATA